MAGKREQRVAKVESEAMADRVLAVVRALTAELHAGTAPAVALDTRLDLDLGLDSLSRGQLLLEVERAFGVSLPERVAAEAGTPRDLLRAVRAAGSAPRPGPSPAPVAASALEPVASAPDGARTLADVLAWHVAAHPDRPHVRLLAADGTEAVVTYRELADRAARVAGGLVARGLTPGRSVAIMLPTGMDYLASFFGTVLAGGVPVPIYPPARPNQIEDHLRRHAGILDNARAAFLLTVPEGKAVSRLLAAHVEGLKGVETVAEVAAGADPVTEPALAEGDTAFLQYTSGSTGRPKGVVLTHANLLANIRAMGTALHADSTDVCVSWLPLYHDMGLIGAWLGSLYYAVPLVLLSPLSFLARPSRWLWAIHGHRGTVAAAPNFAYELCLRKVTEAEVEGLDLSTWRLALNGAEPVSPETLRRFGERFAPHGFRAGSMTPVYGLAECSVGLSFPPLGRGPRIDPVARDPFTRDGRAAPSEAPDALRFVSAGYPLPGHQVRVVDDDGRELPERREGRLEFRGPSATGGYFRNPEATRALFDGDWLDSGDLAYVAEGEVFITARAKDVIIRAGRNIYPHELDEAVGALPGIRKGCVVTFAAHDPRARTERLVILAETREADPAVKADLRSAVTRVATELLGEPPDDVVLASPHTVLKTSSGKIRRADSRRLYESGRIGAGPRGVGWQLVRLLASAVVPALRQARRDALERAYAAWAWTVAGLLAPPVWLAVALAPGRRLRWRLAGAAARTLARLSGTPLSVEGLEHLPRAGGFVMCANHSSYLDGFVLTAAVPVPLGFIAKAELAGSFVTRTLLGRLGARYVERFDLQRGLADARRIAGEAGGGSPLAFFPEGTFQRMPGLQPFHMGAFVAAAEAGVPVVPVVVRGTRSILREGSWFPRRGRVRVTVCPPIHPEGKGWNAAVALRDATRQAMLARVGEPDLGAGPSPLRLAGED
jgi:1-acyl-sn-glycerol-3-phosphate acyltransferase